MLVFKSLPLLCIWVCLGSTPGSAFAQLPDDELPANAVGIKVDNRVGEFLPLDLIFTDERGNGVGLGKFFNKGKPIVLTLNYSDCPGLCIAQLDNLVGNLKEPQGDGVGDKYEIITVSIDPLEDYVKAARTKEKYVEMLSGTKAREGWHFLTGKYQDIQKLADSVGFRYFYDKPNKRYNHPAVTYFISSEGRVCRYFLSLGIEPDQFKFAIAEAAEGKLTESIGDAIIQFCYQYDPDANRYSADARRLMALGGALFTVMLFGLTAPFWFSRRGAAKQPLVDCQVPENSTESYTKSES